MLRTESLWIGKAEAVRVTFDRARIGFGKLLAHAGRTQCDRFVYTTSDAQLRLARAAFGERARALASVTADGAELRVDDEQQYYLLQTPLRSVPMTATRYLDISLLRHSCVWGIASGPILHSRTSYQVLSELPRAARRTSWLAR